MQSVRTNAIGLIVNLPQKIVKHCERICESIPKRNHSNVRFRIVAMRLVIQAITVNTNVDILRTQFSLAIMRDAISPQTSQILCNHTSRSIKGKFDSNSIECHQFLTIVFFSRLKPFLCDFENCSSSFYTRSKLEAHRRKHLASGEFPMSLTHVEDKDKPIVCTYPNCGKRFINAAGLAGHEVTHLATHNKYGAFLAEHEREKPVVCNFPNCGKRFLNTAGLAGHEVTHRNFISQNMGAIFKNLSFNQLKSLGIFSVAKQQQQQQQQQSNGSSSPTVSLSQQQLQQQLQNQFLSALQQKLSTNGERLSQSHTNSSKSKSKSNSNTNSNNKIGEVIVLDI